jgi:hypothetical protein
MNTQTYIYCGNCQSSLTDDDLCGYHDLNELFIEELPATESYRCCDCMSNLLGQC